MSATELSTLQRRIIGALQVDGRASWRKIAEVLGEPERTVTRHGSGLLQSGRIVIAALHRAEHHLVVACESGLGTGRLVGEALARQTDASFVYFTSGTHAAVAEIEHRNNLEDLLTVQLPSLPGLQNFAAYPVLKHFKTLRNWRCGVLTAAEEQALSAPAEEEPNGVNHIEHRSLNDEPLFAALREDGRMGTEELARRTRMSKTSVVRRLRWLIKSGQLSICCVVDPALLGFSQEALLWIKVPPRHLEELGHHLQQYTEVRYVAVIASEYQLLVSVSTTSHAHLYAFLSHPVLSRLALHIRTDTVFAARKRGGQLLNY